jgi:AcrR family transcriptional regulator
MAVTKLASTGRRRARPDPRVSQTRQLVLAATLELMAEHHSGALTVERIAERSGVARSTIYRRWPDPARLHFEAFRQLRSQRLSDPVGDTPADIAMQIRDNAARLNDPTYFSIIVFLLAHAGRSEAYAQAHLELFQSDAARGALVFRMGIESGMIRRDVDVWDAANAMRAPLVYTRLAKHEPIDVIAALGAVPRLMDAFGTPRGRAAAEAWQAIAAVQV